MITANEVFQGDVAQKKRLILGCAVGLDSMDSEIERAREISRVINIFLPDYFKLALNKDSSKEEGSILETNNLNLEFSREINLFKPEAILKLKGALPTKQELIHSSKNIYEMSGAVKLAFANKTTRMLSTSMGMLWERLASISPYAINPEIEFGLRIKGIDLIVLNKNKSAQVIEYQQLKTQHNTLTGSQTTRSVEELKIHANPVFCAVFANNSSWTFNHPNIQRASGDDFWSRIGISYEFFLKHAKKLILELEQEYVALI
jgi:hypothetical protein